MLLNNKHVYYSCLIIFPSARHYKRKTSLPLPPSDRQTQPLGIGTPRAWTLQEIYPLKSRPRLAPKEEKKNMRSYKSTHHRSEVNIFVDTSGAQ